MTNETMQHPDGSPVKWTHKQFKDRLAHLTPEERAYVLRMRRELGIDKAVS